LLRERTTVNNLHVSKHVAGRRVDTKCLSMHSCVESQVTNHLERLTADSECDLSRTYSSHSRNCSGQLTMKAESICDEKVSKKDAADIVINQLTPYYKSHRFGSKVYLSSDT